METGSAVDPDPYVFRHPGSRSIIICTDTDQDPSVIQQKNSKKTLFPLFWVTPVPLWLFIFEVRVRVCTVSKFTDPQSWKQREQTKTTRQDKKKNENEENKQTRMETMEKSRTRMESSEKQDLEWKSKRERNLNLKHDDKLQYVATVHSHSSYPCSI